MAEYRQLRPAYEVVYPKEFNLIDCVWAYDVYNTCVMLGPSREQVPAGIVQFVARQQLENNPFSGQYEPLQNAINHGRARVNQDYLLVAKALISSAFHYQMEEIDTWSADKFFTRLAQTEILFGQVGTLVDPNAPIKPQKQKRVPLPSTPQSPRNTIGDENVLPSQQRGFDTETYVVTSKKYPHK